MTASIILALAPAGGFTAMAVQVAASSPGATIGTSAPSSDVLLQFDQLRVTVPAGQPLPSPDAFEQQYASAAQLLKGETLDQIRQASAELQSKLPKPESVAHMKTRAGVMTGAGMAEDLALSRIPVVGEVVSAVQGGITSEVRKKQEEHLNQALQQYSQSMMSLFQRPQLLHVSAWGDRLRMEDADTGDVSLVQPDRQRVVVLEPVARTYTIQPLAANPLAQSTGCDQAPSEVTTLGTAQVAGVPAQGYRFHEEGKSLDGAAMEVTITRYVSDYRLPIETMATLLGMNCAPDSAAMRNAPGGEDHLAVYAAFAHAAPGQAGAQGMPSGLAAMMSPQFVLWRGHLHTAPADPALFEIPVGYQPAPPAPLPAAPSSSITSSSQQ